MTFPEPGTRFFQLSWAGTIAFVITAGAAAASPSTFELAAVAVSLTLQLNLFTEMPFVLSFPSILFTFMAVAVFVVAVVASYLPARELMRAPIARVVKGAQWVE